MELGRLLPSRFGCMDDTAPLVVQDELPPNSGFFRFGPEVICYGRCAGGRVAQGAAEDLWDADAAVNMRGSTVELPFDPRHVVDNLRGERYLTAAGRGKRYNAASLVRSLYYWVRPVLSVPVRRHIQRLYFRGWEDRPFPRWPADPTVETLFERLLLLSMKARGVQRVPFIWFWPDGHSSCTMMTHDVETTAGLKFCGELMDLNDSFGIKSSFHIVPEKRYKVTESALNAIRSRGFEIDVHDLNHDGLLMSDYSEFRRRAPQINSYGKQFGAEGFRSAVMYRNIEWYGDLDFSYDMSIPNVAHLDPQQGGCCTVMPFFIGNMIELPLTTTQDYSLYHILTDYSIGLWKIQISLIRKKHGLISFIIHPDYNIEPKARRVYSDLLKYLAEMESRGETWIALPRDIAHWWRLRSKLKLVDVNGVPEIQGEGKERARVAYAVLGDGGLTYESPGVRAPVSVR